MKRLLSLSLAVCVLGMLCSLTGCKQDKPIQPTFPSGPDFPLEKDVILAALEEAGLQGVISESETLSDSEGNLTYVIRHPTETYDNTDTKLLIASVGSAIYEEERVLMTLFEQREISVQIAWEEWKQQILYAALLYGGFENEEDVYQAFLEKEIPNSPTPYDIYGGNVDYPRLYWDAQLPEGYCRVSYTARSHKTYGEDDVVTWVNSAILGVNIYESYEVYQKIQDHIAAGNR